jgi:hypothetical protein
MIKSTLGRWGSAFCESAAGAAADAESPAEAAAAPAVMAKYLSISETLVIILQIYKESGFYQNRPALLPWQGGHRRGGLATVLALFVPGPPEF